MLVIHDVKFEIEDYCVAGNDRSSHATCLWPNGGGLYPG